MGSATTLYQAAKAQGIKPILGCEMYVVPDHLLVNDKEADGQTRHLTVLALSFEGYQNLVTWQNASMKRPAFYYRPRISLDRMIDTARFPLHHNVILSGCMGGELCQCLLHGDEEVSPYLAESLVGSMAAVFPNFYIELQSHAHSKFLGKGLDNYEHMVAGQVQVQQRLLNLAQKFDVPVILTNDSHYQTQEQRRSHIAMLARKQWRRGKEAHEGETSESQANAFAKQYIYWTNYMRSMERVAETLPSWARDQAIESIHSIVEEADVVLDPLDKFSYTIPRSGYDDPVAEVRRRSKSRLKSMVARHGEVAAKRFEYELETMKDFAHYLLIESDVVRAGRDNGIYIWTRGSAANSLVAYCLGIHRIDPIHYRLIFERFVNPARVKLPDIDFDIEAHRQPDLARSVAEHMAKLEGEGNVMPICAYSTVSNRSAFRMMAAAKGIDEERIDELAKIIPQMIDSGLVSSDEEAYEMLKEEAPDLYEMVADVFDSIGNVTQHACAFVLGTEERPLSTWVPSYIIASSDTQVTQFNMKGIEELGFFKLDLLRLDSLTIIHNVARMLGKDMRWIDTLAEREPGIYELDEGTLEMLREGRTEGIHSMQGGVQRRGCMEVGVESVEDMVAVQALYRPGAGSRTGTDKSFVNRRHGREDWESTNEFVGQYLDETYGYAIYQEQIMEMAFGMGMSGEEVDDLYKAIKTAKGLGRGAKELFDKFEPTYRSYAAKLGWPTEEADDVWAQWYAMQGYAFNRGHASSYAILAAKMAYLKHHYPQEFYTALLDRYPNNPRYLAAAIGDGFTFVSPDVNASGGGYARGDDAKTIRIGLERIKGVGEAMVAAIVRNQPFASIEDMVERVGSRYIKQGEKLNHITILQSVGALESLGISGDEDDETDFRLMEFIPRKPKAFKDCKPKLARRSNGGAWEFLGMERSVGTTQGKTFVAKLFWIPPDAPLVTKTSATGKVDAHLLTVVDENGIPFDLIVTTSKEAESKLVKLLHKRAQGTVICAEGQIVMPFLRGGNPGFRLWGLAGAEDGTPQMWHSDDDELVKWIAYLAEQKRSQRRRAA
jgi:DNA polymerase-3 subunit alpha